MKASVSLCAIALNEEALIADMLSSASSLVDEIIVGVDDRTSDATADIVSRMGGTVVPFAWQDDFASARNQVIERACGQWILVLDADERLTVHGIHVLSDILSDNKIKERTQYNGFTFPIAHLDLNQNCMAISQTVARLFQNRRDLRYDSVVHEDLWLEKGKAAWCEIHTSPVIAHIGYAPELWVSRGKHERNMRLLQKRINENPDDDYARVKLAQEMLVDENGLTV